MGSEQWCVIKKNDQTLKMELGTQSTLGSIFSLKTDERDISYRFKYQARYVPLQPPDTSSGPLNLKQYAQLLIWKKITRNIGIYNNWTYSRGSVWVDFFKTCFEKINNYIK